MRSLPAVALAALVLASLPAAAQDPPTNPCRPYCAPSLPVGLDDAGMSPPAKACFGTEAGGCSNHWGGCSAYVGIEGKLDVCLIGAEPPSVADP